MDLAKPFNLAPIFDKSVTGQTYLHVVLPRRWLTSRELFPVLVYGHGGDSPLEIFTLQFEISDNERFHIIRAEVKSNAWSVQTYSSSLGIAISASLTDKSKAPLNGAEICKLWIQIGTLVHSVQPQLSCFVEAQS